MREIKFRAWDKVNKKMIDVREIDFDTEEINNYTGYIGKRPAISFKNIELMQFTGLKDKNGKEIYEGDIVHFKFHYGGEGIYDTGEFDYDSKGIVNFGGSFGSYYIGTCSFQKITLGSYEYSLKVIGNIHENKELLNE